MGEGATAIEIERVLVAWTSLQESVRHRTEDRTNEVLAQISRIDVDGRPAQTSESTARLCSDRPGAGSVLLPSNAAVGANRFPSKSATGPGQVCHHPEGARLPRSTDEAPATTSNPNPSAGKHKRDTPPMVGTERTWPIAEAQAVTREMLTTSMRAPTSCGFSFGPTHQIRWPDESDEPLLCQRPARHTQTVCQQTPGV